MNILKHKEMKRIMILMTVFLVGMFISLPVYAQRCTKCCPPRVSDPNVWSPGNCVCRCQGKNTSQKTSETEYDTSEEYTIEDFHNDLYRRAAEKKQELRDDTYRENAAEREKVSKLDRDGNQIMKNLNNQVAQEVKQSKDNVKSALKQIKQNQRKKEEFSAEEIAKHRKYILSIEDDNTKKELYRKLNLFVPYKNQLANKNIGEVTGEKSCSQTTMSMSLAYMGIDMPPDSITTKYGNTQLCTTRKRIAEDFNLNYECPDNLKETPQDIALKIENYINCYK